MKRKKERRKERKKEKRKASQDQGGHGRDDDKDDLRFIECLLDTMYQYGSFSSLFTCTATDLPILLLMRQ